MEHAGQAGEDDPGAGGQAADEQRPAAAAVEKDSDPLEAGRADQPPGPVASRPGPYR
jgi:hypothetical protein